MIRAMIVDDEPYCCEALSILLQRYCPQVEVIGLFHSGSDALEPIRRQRPQLCRNWCLSDPGRGCAIRDFMCKFAVR
jgi:hypothetical protein